MCATRRLRRLLFSIRSVASPSFSMFSCRSSSASMATSVCIAEVILLREQLGRLVCNAEPC